MDKDSVVSPHTLIWKAAAFLIAAVVLLPILMILARWGVVGSGEQEIWGHLLATKLDRLLVNTLTLMAGVGLGVTLLGVSLAWLTSLCEFPGQRYFDWALMLPLAVPAYVMAFVFMGLMGYAGPVQTAVRDWFGPQAWFPDVQGPAAVSLVLVLVLYPYVYMLARSAFIAQGRSMMDASRILGLNAWQSVLKVAIPVARPAIVAGVALALMETLADFGAVSVFNYDTFTTAIYNAWYGLFNLTVAAQLASLLLVFVALTLYMEKQGRRKARFTSDMRRQNHRPYLLKGIRGWLAFLYCFAVVTVAFLLPVMQLLSWSLSLESLHLDQRYFGFLWHTLGLGAVAALLTVSMALLLTFARRLPGSGLQRLWMGLAVRVATLGYALPGSVLAVGIVLGFTFLDQGPVALMRSLLGMPPAPVLVGGVFALIVAYSARFLAVAYGPVESGLERISPAIIEAAQSLGAGHGRVMARIYMPLLRPGLLTALVLVFVDVMKEMPATLIMRPFGWDTLAVRIYEMTAEGQWERAAIPALTLIAAGLLPVILLIRSSRRTTA